MPGSKSLGELVTGGPSGESKIPRKTVSGRGAGARNPSEEERPVSQATKAKSLGKM